MISEVRIKSNNSAMKQCIISQGLSTCIRMMQGKLLATHTIENMWTPSFLIFVRSPHQIHGFPQKSYFTEAKKLQWSLCVFLFDKVH